MEAHKSCLSERVCIKPTWDSSSRGVVIPKPSSFSDLQDLVRKALELGDSIAFRVFLVGSGEIKEWAFELIRDGDVLEVEVDYGSLMEQSQVEATLENKSSKPPLKTEQANADSKKAQTQLPADSFSQQMGQKRETSKRKRESDASLGAASKQHKTGSNDQQASCTISSSISAHLPVPVSSSVHPVPAVPLPNQAAPAPTSVPTDASSETQLQGQPSAAAQAEQQQHQQQQQQPVPSTTRPPALPVNAPPSPSPSEHEVMVIQSSDRRRRISVKVTPTQTVRALLPIIQRQWGLSAADYDLFKGNDNVLSAFRSFGDLCQREREVRLILVPQESY